jgi:uncharacterized protein involved in type VI secretion and phage assembly
MPRENDFASQLYVTINGADLGPEYMNVLQEAIVDESTSVPDMVILRFRDPEAKLIDDSIFDPAKTVEISAMKDSGEEVTIFKGEITAIEPHFREGMVADMVVRGLDQSHRMYREVKSRTFLKMTDADIARKIANEGGLTPKVDNTKPVYDYVCQSNQTNLDFLMKRAWRIGFECFEDDRQLYFRKPSLSGGAITLTWGVDLREFRPVMSVAEQVDEVVVRGWDIKKKTAIVGKASSGERYAKTGMGTGKENAKSLGSGNRTFVNLPVTSQAEADQLAQGRLNELSSAFVEATGVAFRRPDIRAGKVIQLEKVGKRFSGNYLVTGVRHVFDRTGLHSEFEVSSFRPGLLGALMGRQEPVERWPGAVVGVVTNANDPENMGRVKVKFPWLSDDVESDWARVISPGAGKERGFFVVPEVGDEVVVIFDQGDFDHPFVVGGLWNGKDKIPKQGADASNNKPLVRTWNSHKGHRITVDDTDSGNKIEIITAKGHSITLDDQNMKIEIMTKGGSKLLIDDNKKTVDLESKGTLNIKSAMPMSIKSDATLAIDAKTVDVKSSGPVTVKGNPVSIN